MKSNTGSDSGERYNQSSASRAFATERDPLLKSSSPQPGYTSISPDHSHSHSYNQYQYQYSSDRHTNNTVRNRSRNRKSNNNNSNSNSSMTSSARDGQRTPPSFAEATNTYSEDNIGHSDTPYEIYNDSNVSNAGRSRDRDSIRSASTGRGGGGTGTGTGGGGRGRANGPGGSFGLSADSRDISRPLGSMRYLRSNRDRDNSISQLQTGPSQSGPSHSRVHNSNSLQSRRTGGDGDRLQQYYNERANRIFSDVDSSNDEPLVEVNQEIMAVRRSALTVYQPLTYTWVSTVCHGQCSV